jgi:multisubunit Na+/H+ antiporter MnhG subunit
VSARHVIAEILLWAGVVLILISCLGVLVMRSAYDRLHYTSPALLGTLLIAVAVVVQESFSLIGNWALATALLLIAGAPILTTATARATRVSQRGDWRLSSEEEEQMEVKEP